MSVFVLKIIAVICMACDHIRYIDPFLDNDYTRLLGRIAFPIFAFLISEGCIHTRNIKKYLQRLFIFAIISEIPYLMFTIGCNITDKWELNVIFTLLCGALSIFCYNKTENIFIKIISIAFFSGLAEFLNMDYGAIGVLLIVNFYIFKDTKILKYLIFILVFLTELTIQCKFNINTILLNWSYFTGYITSSIVLFMYNGERGKYKLKYFFYCFYPIHMIIICLIYSLLK